MRGRCRSGLRCRNGKTPGKQKTVPAVAVRSPSSAVVADYESRPPAMSMAGAVGEMFRKVIAGSFLSVVAGFPVTLHASSLPPRRRKSPGWVNRGGFVSISFERVRTGVGQRFGGSGLADLVES